MFTFLLRSEERKQEQGQPSYFLETSPYRPMSTLPNLSPAQLYLRKQTGEWRRHWECFPAASLGLT